MGSNLSFFGFDKDDAGESDNVGVIPVKELECTGGMKLNINISKDQISIKSNFKFRLECTSSKIIASFAPNITLGSKYCEDTIQVIIIDNYTDSYIIPLCAFSDIVVKNCCEVIIDSTLINKKCNFTISSAASCVVNNVIFEKSIIDINVTSCGKLCLNNDTDNNMIIENVLIRTSGCAEIKIHKINISYIDAKITSSSKLDFSKLHVVRGNISARGCSKITFSDCNITDITKTTDITSTINL